MSKAVKINVDKEKVNDMSYRYKMPAVILKDEGGATTDKRCVFLNLESIASDLKRDPIMIITYLASVLGCKFIADDKDKDNIKYTLYGRFTRDTIQMYVYEFIDRFVLCKSCKNPETRFHSEKKFCISLSCSACSKLSDIPDNKHALKVLKLIAKN